MENIKHVSEIIHDEYVQFVYDKLDVQPSTQQVVEIPMLELHPNELGFEWNIGLICGNSGSGKTSIINELGGAKTPSYDYDKCVVSQFEQFGYTPEQASDMLFNVGLSSIPTWLNKPQQLSNGEKARLDIAMQLAMAEEGEIIYVDEWTSVVNREVAKAMSNSIQKYIRRKNLKVVFVSCHYDIIEWLRCDWIFNLNKVQYGIEHIIYKGDADYGMYDHLCNVIGVENELSKTVDV